MVSPRAVRPLPLVTPLIVMLSFEVLNLKVYCLRRAALCNVSTKFDDAMTARSFAILDSVPRFYVQLDLRRFYSTVVFPL